MLGQWWFCISQFLLIYTVGAGVLKNVTACVNKKKEELLVELEF